MKHVATIIILILISSVTAQETKFKLPELDHQPMVNTKVQISVDQDKQELTVLNTEFYKVMANYRFERYQASLAEIDTVVVMVDEASQTMGFRILMCSGTELEIDDPYSKRNPYSIYNKSRVNIQRWKIKDNYEPIFEVAASLNKLINRSEVCHTKRNLSFGRPDQFQSLSIGSNTKPTLRYNDGVTLPSFRGSSDLDDLNEKLNTYINESVGQIQDTQLVKVDYTLDQQGQITKVQFRDRVSDPLREAITSSLKSTSWIPATKNDETVEVKGTVLLGFNVIDRYLALANQIKTPPSKAKVEVPLNLEGMLGDDFGSNQQDAKKDEQFFRVVEEMPQLLDTTSIRSLLVELNKVVNGDRYSVIMMYMVEKDGSVSDINVRRTTNTFASDWLTKKLQEKIIYKPGRQRGRVVRVMLQQVFTPDRRQ